MDAITVIIMFILFLLAMLFVFSTALLTPYIGKKNLVTVVVLGLIVGIVAGAFLVAPIVEDLPDFTRTVVEESVDGSDVLLLELSTNGNLTEIIQNISSINGVEKIDYDGITFKVDDGFTSDTDKTRFISFLKNTNSNITDVQEVSNGTFYVKFDKDSDPQVILDSIYYTFGQQTYVHLKYTSMQANATVTANNITKIMAAIGESDAAIIDINGPTEDWINAINRYIPNQYNAVLLSGALGVIVALAGFFVDSIYNFISNFRKRKNASTDRERIKRKVVPGTENRQRNRKPINNKRDSIDIFDESFDESPKQTIGSNRKFKQLTSEDLKNKTVNEVKPEKESTGRFSSFKSKISKSNNKKDINSSKETSMPKAKKSTKSRKAPHIRPKRKN